ncbi:MAG: citryl-CoA lyase [Gammaproteobacteria bacterium]|nr:citryl-CoA lyase [Gammaproteobacteria bacterium]MCP4879194.1 citryl-CoA lyase [Gammaproteobacteria bacterium]MDP6165884.1 citryl-CoA lyase [Gammaproteobacteria bacterium]
MTSDPEHRLEKEVSDWWRTEIIEMSPGEIRFRGYAIEELIGNISFAQMIWLMLRGELPTKEQSSLLEIALVAGVDHGPQAPSIAIARMSATCGVGLNNAMASALNVLGDVHGGAGEQAVELYTQIIDENTQEVGLRATTESALKRFFETGQKFVPGFGHRFHPVDPRAPRILKLMEDAAQKGVVSGEFVAVASQIEKSLEHIKGKRIPMNIDGATAVVLAELGFPAPLARGIFCLSRSLGILSHAWEQTEQGGRNKGPIPRRFLWAYEGEGHRALSE